jgi:rhamnosyltransferase
MTQTAMTLAAVVTCEPDLARLESVLRAVLPQVSMTQVIDNSVQSRDAVADMVMRLGVQFRPQPTNIGLAAAYNVAIDQARELGATDILLLDQDSVLPSGYVAAVESVLRQSDRAVVAASGIPRDERAVRYGRQEFRSQRVVQTSGTLFRLEAFEAVGLFEADLFIHHVDKEWFMRARARGYSTRVSPTAMVHTEIGMSVSRLSWMPKGVHWQSDTRLYFGVRNTLRLTRRPYLPLAWRMWHLVKIAILLALHLGFRDGRRALATSALSGIRDGLRQ